MKIDVLSAVGYVVAGIVLFVLWVATTSDLVAPTVLRVVAIVSFVSALTLFVAMLFDRRVQRRIDALNQDIQREQPLGFRWIRLSDEEWGALGTRLGNLPLAFLRLALLAFVFVTALADGVHSDRFAAAASGFAISVLVTFRRLPSDDDQTGA